MSEVFSFSPIATVRSSFIERVDAPRQGTADGGGVGTIEFLPGADMEFALEEIERWDRLWVIFVFHHNIGRGFSPKVTPPRGEERVGVFASRAPYRPNPIGLSAVKLLGRKGLVLRVGDIDILDGTPVLDIKPYVPFADAFPEAGSGFLEARDPGPRFEVVLSPIATAQKAWLDERGETAPAEIIRLLTMGPESRPYRRIRARQGGGAEIALKEWRADFVVAGTAVTIERFRSGWSPAQIAKGEAPAVHAAFVEA